MADLADLEYLRLQRARREKNAAQGNQSLNQDGYSMNDDAVYEASNLENARNQMLFRQQEQLAQQQALQEQESFKHNKENDDWWSKVFGFVDEIAAQFGAGFVRGWEGILDFAATGLGALGDATGWYSSDPFTNWAKKDLGGQAANFVKTYLSPFNNITSAFNGNLKDPDYWRDGWNAFLDTVTLSGYSDNDHSQDIDKYYSFNDRLENGFEEFLGGAAQSIGFMVPSILTGSWAGAAGKAAGMTTKGAQIAAQAASLGQMGLAAAGKGSEEALNDGASAGQALGYGALSGAAEVGSELVVGKALGLVGLGTGKVMGAVGAGSKQTAKIGSKLFLKELGKTMFEEGMEEVPTALLEPLFKATYKGAGELVDENGNSYVLSTSFWFGKDGHFNESAIGQFVSGAFVGGLSSGVHNGTVYKKVGEDGYLALNAWKNLGEADVNMGKEVAKNAIQYGTDAYDKANAPRTKAANEFIEALDKFMASATNSQKAEFARYLTEDGALARDLQRDKESGVAQASVIDNYLAELKADVEGVKGKDGKNVLGHERLAFRNMMNELQDKFGTDYRVSFVDGIDGNARISQDAKTIEINSDVLKGNIGGVIAHEYIQHAIASGLAEGKMTSDMYDAVKASMPKAWVNEVEAVLKNDFDRIEERAKAEQWSADELEKAKEALRRDETVAYFLEDFAVDSNKSLDAQLRAFRKLFKKDGLLRKFLNRLNHVDTYNLKALSKAYVQNVASYMRSLQRAFPNNPVALALAKYNNGIALTDSEKKIKSQFGKIFEALSPKNGKAVLQYSHDRASLNNKGYLVDDQGKQLRVKYDEDGTLWLVEGFHNTIADKRAQEVEYSVKGKEVFQHFDVENALSEADVETLFDEGFDIIINSDDEVFVRDQDEQLASIEQEATNGKRAETANMADGVQRRKIVDLSDGDFQRFVSTSGSLYSSDGEAFYLREIKRRKLYKSIKVNGKEAHVIPYEYYTERMSAIADVASAHGLDNLYFLTEKSDVLGSALGVTTRLTNGEWVVFVDASESNILSRDFVANPIKARSFISSIDQTARHEFLHFLFRTNDSAEFFKLSLIKKMFNVRNASIANQINEAYEEFKGIWNSYSRTLGNVAFDEAIYEEMLCELYSEDLLLNGNEARAWQNKLINEINEFFNISKEQSNSFRYSQKRTHVGAAITFDTQITTENFNKTMQKFRPMIDKLNENLSSLMGISPTKIGNAYGGYAFEEDAGKVVSGEPSFPMQFDKYKNIEEVLKYSALVGDLGFESQSAVYVWEVLDKSAGDDPNTKNARYEVPLKKTGENLLSFIKENYNGGFTLPEDGKSIIIATTIDESTGLTWDGKNPDQVFDEIEEFIGKLKEGGFVDESREAKHEWVKFYDLNRENRKNVYSSWSETLLQQSTGKEGLLNLVQDAQKVNDWIINNEDGTKNAKEILALLKGGQYSRKRNAIELATEQSEVVDAKVEVEKSKTKIPAEYIKAAASLSNDKVYALSEAKATIQAISQEIFKATGIDSSKYHIVYNEGTLYEATRNLFELFNKRNVTTAEIVKGLNELFADVRIVANGNPSVSTPVIADGNLFNDANIQEIIEKHIKDFTLSGEDSFKAKSKKELAETKGKLREHYIDIITRRTEAFKALYSAMRTKLSAYARDMRARIDPTHTLRQELKAVVKNGLNPQVNLNGTQEQNALTIRTQMGSVIAAPFMNIVYKRNGNFGTLLKTYQELKTELDKVLSQYTQEAYDAMTEKPLFPFDQAIRDEIQAFRDSLDELPEPRVRKDGVTIYPNLTTEQIKKATTILKAIDKLHRKTVNHYSETLRPQVIGARQAVSQQTGERFIRFLSLNPYVFNAASFYSIINARLGNSTFARNVTIGMELADGKRKSYIGSTARSIEQKVSELGLGKHGEELAKKVTFNGVEMQVGTLLDLYCGLKSIDFDNFNKNGVTYKDSKGVVHKVVEAGNANAALKSVKELLPQNVMKYGDWLIKEIYNGKFLNDYITYRSERGYHNAEVSGNYYPQSADLSGKPTDVTQMVKAPKVFQNDKARVDHDNPFVIHDATRRVMQYANDLATAMYVYPLYRENFYVLQQVWQDLGTNAADIKFREALRVTLGMWVGLDVKGNKSVKGPINFLIGNYTRTLLSFNVGTPFKQTISLLFSNFGLSKALRGVANRIFGSEAFKTEFAYLANNFAAMAYRSIGSERVKIDTSSGAGKVVYYMRKLSDVGMKFIEIFDNATIQAGLASSMVVAKDMGYRMGTAEYRAAVEELFANFVETQIGSNPSNLSRLARGDSPLDSIGKYASYMQGPMRAALAAFVDKFTTWRIARKWTKAEVDQKVITTKEAMQAADDSLTKAREDLASLRSELAELRDNYELEADEKADLEKELKGKIDKAETEVEAKEEAFANAKSEYLQAEQNKKTFTKYQAQGGKRWMLSSASAMAVGAIINALIEALARRIKGKEEWDEWDIGDIAQNAVLYGTVGWLPMASTIVNAVKGYDTSYPTGAIFTEFGEIVSALTNAFKNGFDEKSSKALFRELITAISIGTGLPIKNIYNLVYGAVYAANKPAAEQLSGLFYVNRSNNAKIIDAIEAGDDQLALQRINKLVSDNCGSVSDSVKREMLSLVKDGESPFPSAIAKAYTNSKGEEVNITWTQQQEAKKFYAKANAAIAKLVFEANYKKLSTKQKAAVIKATYSAYRQAALMRAIPNYDGQVSKIALLAKTGTTHVSSIIAAVYAIRELKATKTKTRKQLAIAYVNKLKVTRAERLIILSLAGFSADEKAVWQALKSLGMKSDDINTFLGKGKNKGK